MHTLGSSKYMQILLFCGHPQPSELNLHRLHAHRTQFLENLHHTKKHARIQQKFHGPGNENNRCPKSGRPHQKWFTKFHWIGLIVVKWHVLKNKSSVCRRRKRKAGVCVWREISFQTEWCHTCCHNYKEATSMWKSICTATLLVINEGRRERRLGNQIIMCCLVIYILFPAPPNAWIASGVTNDPVIWHSN